MKSLKSPSRQEIGQWIKILGTAKFEMSKHRNNIKVAYGRGFNIIQC